jgi:hypothetical protein
VLSALLALAEMLVPGPPLPPAPLAPSAPALPTSLSIAAKTGARIDKNATPADTAILIRQCEANAERIFSLFFPRESAEP